MTEETYLSAVQVGKRLGVTSVTVVRWIKAGYIHARRRGLAPTSGWLVSESEVRRLEAQLAGNTTQEAGHAEETQTE